MWRKEKEKEKEERGARRGGPPAATEVVVYSRA